MMLKHAKIMAENLRAALSPFCLRCEIAGGIRRGKEEPHDIELVVIPLPQKPPLQFGNRIPVDAYQNTLFLKLWEMERDNLIKKLKGKDKYRKYQIDPEKWGGPISNNYEVLDLFIVTPETWGYQFTIRTGPDDFSHWCVTPKSQGGGLPDGVYEKEARLYNYDGLIVTNEELEFFQALQLEYIQPSQRQANWGKRQ